MKFSRDRYFVGALALAVLAAVLVLGPSIHNGFAWDDRWLILENPNIQQPGRLGLALRSAFWDIPSRPVTASSWIYYWPFITLVYAGLWRVFGPQAWGYHALNLLAHLGCVVLAGRWLRDRFTPRDDPGWGVAFAAAVMLFAVHGSRVETVVWVAGCTDIWMTLWLLLACALWSRGRSVLAAIPAVLAALSKEVAFALPVLLALDLALGVSPPEVETRPTPSRWRGVAIIAGALLVALVVRLVLVPPSAFAAGSAMEGGIFRRVLSTLGAYLSRAIWPWPDAVVFRPERYLGGPWWIIGLVGLAGLGALAWRSRRSPSARAALADVAWFALPLVPVLNVMAISGFSLLGQRFLYLPLLGLCALALRLASLGPRPARVVAAVLSLLVVAHGASLRGMVPTWRDDLTLWRRAHQIDRDDLFVCKQLVVAETETRVAVAEALAAGCSRDASRRGSHQQALLLGLRALGVRLRQVPEGDRESLVAFRETYLSIEAGRVAQAEVGGLRLTLRPDPRAGRPWREDPALLEGPLALVTFRLGLDDEAEGRFRRVLASHPSDISTLMNLAVLLGRRGRWDEALALVGRVRSLAPDAPGRGRLERTLRSGASLPTEPDPDRRALGFATVMLELGAPGRAFEALQRFGDAAPPPAVLLRARALVAQGRVGEALALVEAAKERDPEHRRQWEGVLGQLRALPARRGAPGDSR